MVHLHCINAQWQLSMPASTQPLPVQQTKPPPLPLQLGIRWTPLMWHRLLANSQAGELRLQTPASSSWHRPQPCQSRPEPQQKEECRREERCCWDLLTRTSPSHRHCGRMAQLQAPAKCDPARIVTITTGGERTSESI